MIPVFHWNDDSGKRPESFWLSVSKQHNSNVLLERWYQQHLGILQLAWALYFQVVWYSKTVKCDQLWAHTFRSSKITEDNWKLKKNYVFFCDFLIVQSNLKFDSTPNTRHSVYNSKKICFGYFPIITAVRVQTSSTHLHI